MSVIMTLELRGDPKALERFASENKDKMRAVLEAAKDHGLIAHRFYGSEDGGKVMVLDEWPDRQSFESFFQEQESEIQSIIQSMDPTSEPEPNTWQELVTHDKFGWGT